MSIEDHTINRDLKLSYWMGFFRCCMTGFTQDFFTPFLLLLGGTARQVGIMNSCNNFFPAILQTASAEATAQQGSRKKVVALCFLLQGLSLLAMVLLVLDRAVTPVAFIVPVVLFSAFGAFINPGWTSLLSDMVRPHRRGIYFGWRSRNLGFITVATTISAGLILYALSGINKRDGFLIIFSCALVCGVLSWLSLGKVDEPPLEFRKEDRFTFLAFIRQYRTSNFVRFTLFVAFMNFCVNLAAPYFAVLMLQDLKFNYLLFSLVNTVSLLTLYATIQRWGQQADRVGNLKVIRLVAPLLCCSPLCWIISRNPVFLIPVEMFSGFLWAGFNLCTSNFIMDAVTPAKRTRCMAYFTLINGIGLAAGAIIGGYLIHFLPPLFHYKILTLFLISGGLRIAAGLWLPRHIKEVRPVDGISNPQLFFSMLGISKPAMKWPIRGLLLGCLCLAAVAAPQTVHGEAKLAITIVPVGKIPPAILADLAGRLSQVFDAQVSLGAPAPVVEIAYNPARRQYRSTKILEQIAQKYPQRKGKVLAVIDQDLYVPDLNFVFGEADLPSGICIVSLARLRPSFYGQPDNDALFLERAGKEAVHELGHLLGLRHCLDPRCVMFFSNRLKDTDRKEADFCARCRKIMEQKKSAE
jgi:predicted Zn-dependent protease